MVQCFDCKKCIIMINEKYIICVDENLPYGFRMVGWECAADDEDPCSGFIRREE